MTKKRGQRKTCSVEPGKLCARRIATLPPAFLEIIAASGPGVS